MKGRWKICSSTSRRQTIHNHHSRASGGNVLLNARPKAFNQSAAASLCQSHCRMYRRVKRSSQHRKHIRKSREAITNKHENKTTTKDCQQNRKGKCEIIKCHQFLKFKIKIRTVTYNSTCTRHTSSSSASSSGCFCC